ncbi:MAG TPA: Trp family transcriptional regulator, partial [Patescibacteria group bacterium]|nr:Trp family transcriptional regulator [Patescibacteria group bacterium]
EELMGRVLTPSEIEMVSKRISIAVLLEVGADYRQIQQLIKVSKATIAKVNNLYRYDEPFRKLIQKFVKEEHSSKPGLTLTGAAKGLGEALRLVSQIH